MPVVLRPLRNGHYKFIGEAYVRGATDGELVSGSTEGETVVID